MEPIIQEPHPLLRAAAFISEFSRSLGETASPAAWAALLRPATDTAPLARKEPVRAAVRDMLRQGGYKPTGRGKPASEYLVRAAEEEGSLRPINAAVDACNIVSLHSGLPISVVDLARCHPPLSIRIAAPGERYVFNPAGQEIELAGLLCLCDAAGPCGNAVKDAQRTKTHEGTTLTLSVVWGVAGHEPRLERAVAWYRELLQQAGAETQVVVLA
jgi:DNA/RNA-binding domain of Phe-tRNA-synthetase-like protein